MKIKNLSEIIKEKEKTKISEKDIYITSDETIEAINEAFDISKGVTFGSVYHSFEEMWSDICGT